MVLRLFGRLTIKFRVQIPDWPSFDDDEREQEEAEEDPESDDERDTDSVLAVDVQSRRERGQDGAVLRVVDRLLPVGREPFQTS